MKLAISIICHNSQIIFLNLTDSIWTNGWILKNERSSLWVQTNQSAKVKIGYWDKENLNKNIY